MKKKIRVLEITHGLAPGGIESFVINVFENINKENLDINFAIACEGEQYHEERILSQKAKIYRTNDLNGIKNIFKHFFRLIRLLKSEGPFDVVHTHIDFFNGVNLLAAFIAGVPVRISHAHNTNSAHTDKEEVSLFIKLYRFMMRCLINTFATVKLGCSKDANIYMYGKNNCENSTVIYNGIDLEKFKYKDRKISDDSLNFITIGRMCEQKNSLFIVKIVNELKKINKNIHLSWVGKGPLEEEIKLLIKENKLEDNIELLGLRKDIPDLLSEMDFMLFPSKWEGLPVTLIEAQASGLPCFISNKITDEADLGLCTITDINKDEKEWAYTINSLIESRSYNNDINTTGLNLFDINKVSDIIKNIYEESVMKGYI